MAHPEAQKETRMRITQFLTLPEITTLIQTNRGTTTLNEQLMQQKFGINGELFNPTLCDPVHICRVTNKEGEQLRCIIDGHHRASFIAEHYEQIKGNYPHYQGLEIIDATDIILQRRDIKNKEERNTLTALEYLEELVFPTQQQPEIATKRIAIHFLDCWKHLVGEKRNQEFSGLAALAYLAFRRAHEHTPPNNRNALEQIAKIIRQMKISPERVLTQAFQVLASKEITLTTDEKNQQLYGLRGIPWLTKKFNKNESEPSLSFLRSMRIMLEAFNRHTEKNSNIKAIVIDPSAEALHKMLHDPAIAINEIPEILKETQRPIDAYERYKKRQAVEILFSFYKRTHEGQAVPTNISQFLTKIAQEPMSPQKKIKLAEQAANAIRHAQEYPNNIKIQLLINQLQRTPAGNFEKKLRDIQLAIKEATQKFLLEQETNETALEKELKRARETIARLTREQEETKREIQGLADENARLKYELKQRKSAEITIFQASIIDHEIEQTFGTTQWFAAAVENKQINGHAIRQLQEHLHTQASHLFWQISKDQWNQIKTTLTNEQTNTRIIDHKFPYFLIPFVREYNWDINTPQVQYLICMAYRRALMAKQSDNERDTRTDIHRIKDSLEDDSRINKNKRYKDPYWALLELGLYGDNEDIRIQQAKDMIRTKTYDNDAHKQIIRRILGETYTAQKNTEGINPPVLNDPVIDESLQNLFEQAVLL